MHVLITSLASHGHTYPILPLATATRRAGHQVTYATHSSFHPVLTGLGFAVEDVGMTISEAFAEVTAGQPIDFANREKMEGLVGKVFASALPRRVARDLGPVLERVKPDLVIYEAATIGAGFAARAAGIPVLCHAFGRGNVREPFSDMKRLLAEVAAEFGVPFDPTSASPDPYLDIFPESLQDTEFLAVAADRIPIRPVPFAEPGELPAWVAEHREPLTYLTLGTAFGQAHVLRTAIDGLAGLPGRVLVAAGPTVDVGTIGAVPDNVTVLPWVPQADLLPHVDLVVHHGGSGTTLGALAAGIPQLFLPQGADQFVNADAIAASGAGAQLVGDEFTAEAVTAKSRDLLADESVTARAREVAAEIAAMPAPEDIAARLPEFA
ncbi:glycosyltransferase, MGT family [Alloactinosynnema sp. L-07]|uniref:glycosyltransferase n=1 Tax=Alloactinosynnema sp. L-07 TaxID=1653480 RepID=UPI00065F0947|nr:glycosyltransferase [Alloactinosynnema sp. L-07]CRK62058.1 glycosyltransferase, MGT family [Alloactinosynnema sp. L-07]